jgi:hypothetical protein
MRFVGRGPTTQLKRKEEEMKSTLRLVVMLCLVVTLVACESIMVKHAAYVQERSSLSPEKCYVGGTNGYVGIGVSMEAILYVQVMGGGLLAIDLQPGGGLFLAELPPGEYRVDHLSIMTSMSNWQWVNVGVSDLSDRRIEAVPGQVTYIGDIMVTSTYLVLVTTYKARFSANHAGFELALRQAYDLPESMSIVDVPE